MPRIDLNVESSEQTITRRVILDVAKDLAIALGLPEETEVRYPQTNEPETLKQSLDERLGNTPLDPRMDVYIEAQERYIDENIHTTPITAKYTPLIFSDSALELRLAPVYARMRVELTVTIRLPDRARVRRLFDDLRLYASKNRDWFYHELHYVYLFPMAAYAIISKVHELREAQAGYGESFKEYLSAHLDEQVTMLSNLSGEERRLAKEEVQTGVLGYPDFTSAPETIERLDEDSSAEFDFTYTFEYDKPFNLHMEYPLVVHNQPMPSRYFTHLPAFDLPLRKTRDTRFSENIKPWMRHRDLITHYHGPAVPSFMDWYPPSHPHYIYGIFRLLLLIDTDTPHSLFDFNDLGRLSLDSDYLDLIRRERSYLHDPHQSFFQLYLYEDDRPKSSEHLEVTSELEVLYHNELDIRKRYNFYFGVCAHLSKLDKDVLDRLCDYGHMTIRLLKAIDSGLEDEDLPRVLNLSGSEDPDNDAFDGYVPKTDLKETIRQIEKRSQVFKAKVHYSYYHVARFYINTQEE